MNTAHKGFTLIELMITVAIIAILAAIAFPSYQEQVRRTNRAEGQRELMEAAQRLERCFTEYNAYNHASCNVSFPITSDEGKYELTATERTASSFSLTATRAGTQIGDRCGNFTLTHTGAKGIASAAAGLTAADCWR